MSDEEVDHDLNATARAPQARQADDGTDGERRRIASERKSQMVGDILALKDLPDQIDAPVIDYPEAPRPRERELTPKQQREVEAARRSVRQSMAIEGRVPEGGSSVRPIKRRSSSQPMTAKIAALRETEERVQKRDEDDA